MLKTSLVIAGDEQGGVAALRNARQELDAVTAAAQRSQAQVAGMGSAMERSAGEARVGYMMLGQQAQDVAIMLQGGANIGTIIATQGGQVATAVSMMGGRMGGFASFMAGPWGAAITIGIAVLANLVTELGNVSSAAKTAEEGADSLAKAQSSLAGLFDASNGRIAEQTKLLLANAQAMALNLRSEALAKRSSAEKVFGKTGDFSLQRRLIGLYAPIQGRESRSAGEAASIVSMVRSGLMTPQAALRQSAGLDYSNLKVTKLELQQAILDAATADLNLKTADLIDQSLTSGSLVSGLAKPGKERAGNRRGSAGRSAGAAAEFGEDTAAKIAGIRDQFSDLPAAIGRSNQALRQLDDIASDIERRKPINGAALQAEVELARRAIEDSLNKPFNDFMQAQRESAEIDKLILAGRYDEAEALKIVLRLQEQQGPLQRDQLAAVLKTVEAERQRSMVLRDQQALIQANLDAVYDMRGALEQTVGNMLRGRFSFDAILSSIGNSFIRITSKRIVESMFGETLRALEDQATGQDKVRAASDSFAGSLGDGGRAVEDFATIVRRAGDKIANAPSPAPDAASGGADGLGNGEIVVEAPRSRRAVPGPNGGFMVDMVDQMLRRLGVALPRQLTDAVKSSLGRLETSLPELMKGAMIGQAGASLFLGQGGNNAGSLIGGAFGESLFKKAAPSLFKKLGDFAGPLGSIAGGLIGGLVGGLFKKTKSGGASIGLDASGNAAITGTSGNNADLKKQASGWGGTINNQLDRIAEALGASLGSYSVAIGKRDSGWIKVSASGNAAATTAKKPTSDIIYNGKDEGEALMVALANAISDGAIAGVSAAVQKALKSSSDVEKAVREAMKVQEVELLIGGLGSELEKAFKDFERQAAERLRIGRQYGFDLAKLEERNAKDRLKLTERLLAEQVGSLQNLIDEMTSGSLFEGSSVDQRRLLLDKITAAKAAADAGEEGAAEKLATLLEQLNRVSRDAFGTTGGFAQDRQTILDAARDTIAKANQRITDAQKASDPALAQTNAALDENNGQNAQMIALLGDMAARLAQLRQAGGFAGDTLSALARTS